MEYKLCQKNLEQLVEFGFKINWTLLQAGYRGKLFMPSQFAQNDIIAYALEQLESNDNNLVARLACAGNDRYEFDSILQRLVNSEKVDKEMQIRKLRALIVFRGLKALPDDYTEGLIELTEIWCSLGFPDDRPPLSIDDYYTKEMYETLKKRNYDWLDNEILYIISEEDLST